MKNLITIGLPSKGRLKEGSINFLARNNLNLTSNGGERNYFAEVENFPNIKIIYLHAKEIIQNMQFDYIYHEHTYYFTIQTLSYFAKLYDLYPNDVKESKISGGSLILTFSKNKKQFRE